MRRFLPALLAVLAFVRPVSADNDAEVRKKAKELLESAVNEQDWEKRQKITNSLRRAAGAPAALIEEALARPDFHEKGWSLAGAMAPVLDARRGEAIEPVRSLLRDKDEKKALFGFTLMDQAGLTAALAADVVAAMSRGDNGAAQAVSSCGNCRDPRLVELLIKEFEKGGGSARNAITGLAYTGADAAKPFLRKLARDAAADAGMRSQALNGLVRGGTKEDAALAIELLADKEEQVVGAALNYLGQNKVVAPVEALKKAKEAAGEWNKDVLDRLMSAAGDPAAAKACLRRAKGGSEWDKSEWYLWAGRSGVKELKADLEKAFGEETEEGVRMAVLQAIGELGDPASLDLIVKYLSHPEQGWRAMGALSALARRTPEVLDAVLDRLAEQYGGGGPGLDSFPYNYLEKAEAADRVRLMDAFVRLLDRVADRPRVRSAVLSVLSEMARPDFGQSEEAVGKWKEWWGKNRESWGAAVPKGQ